MILVIVSITELYLEKFIDKVSIENIRTFVIYYHFYENMKKKFSRTFIFLFEILRASKIMNK